jgi:predicted transcriptional regulator
MIKVLAQQHQIGVTDLALLSRVNHQRCMINLSWMEGLGLVRITPKNNRKEVVVTETGKEYIEKWVSLPSPSDVSRKDRSASQLLNTTTAIIAKHYPAAPMLR